MHRIARTAVAVALLWVASPASAAPTVWLPSSEDAESWQGAFDLAGLEPSATPQQARIHIEAQGTMWALTVPDGHGGSRTVRVEAPRTESDREAVALVAQGLARDLSTTTKAPPPLTVAPPPPPPAAPPVEAPPPPAAPPPTQADPVAAPPPPPAEPTAAPAPANPWADVLGTEGVAPERTDDDPEGDDTESDEFALEAAPNPAQQPADRIEAQLQEQFGAVDDLEPYESALERPRRGGLARVEVRPFRLGVGTSFHIGATPAPDLHLATRIADLDPWVIEVASNLMVAQRLDIGGPARLRHAFNTVLAAGPRLGERASISATGGVTYQWFMQQGVNVADGFLPIVGGQIYAEVGRRGMSPKVAVGSLTRLTTFVGRTTIVLPDGSQQTLIPVELHTSLTLRFGRWW